MKIFKLLISAMLAVVVTVGLFGLMTKLISQDYKLEKDTGPRIVDITMPPAEIDEIVDEAPPEKPEQAEQPPEIPDQPMDTPDISNSVAIAGPAPVKADLGGGLNIGDGEMLPIVRVQPNYPRRAAELGIEGWVLIELTVTEDGLVTDEKVIDAEPGSIFDREALKAVKRFKYKPRVVDGKPVAVTGVTYKFTFGLED